jgi:hypothetical protein
MGPSPLRLVIALLLAATCIGCGALGGAFASPRPTPSRALGAGEQWVRFELWEPINGVPTACGGVGYDGNFRLHGAAADPKLVWMTFPDGSRHDLAWPVGYSARFTPALELLDGTGQVVGREGSLITGGCGIPREPDVLWVSLESLPPVLIGPGPS